MKHVGYLFCGMGLFVLGMIFDGLITRIPREANTVTQMAVVERELMAYSEKHGALPKTIDDLVHFSSGLDGCLTNSWGQPICYQPIDATNAVLSTTGYGDIEFVRRISLPLGKGSRQ